MVNDTNLIQEFEEYLRRKNKSENTVINYHSSLISFFNSIAESYNQETITDDLIININCSDVENFDNQMSERGLSASTRVAKINALASFYNWLMKKKKIIKENPTNDFDMPVMKKKEPIYMELEDVKKLLDIIKNSDKPYKERDYAMFSLFLTIGLRREELVNLNIDSIKGDVIDIVGKGNKERCVVVYKKWLEILNDYLRVRPNIENENALFVNYKGQRLNKNTINKILKEYIEEAELDSKYTPHKLRHTAATLMYKTGKVDIRTLQKILGHESIISTQDHIHIDSEDKRKAIESNPISDII